MIMSRIDEITQSMTVQQIYERGKYLRDGKIDEDGIRHFPDPERAEKYLERAAERGHADAQYDLACLYETFTGDKYIAKAIEWYEVAVMNGHAGAAEALERLQPDEELTWDSSRAIASMLNEIYPNTDVLSLSDEKLLGMIEESGILDALPEIDEDEREDCLFLIKTALSRIIEDDEVYDARQGDALV